MTTMKNWTMRAGTGSEMVAGFVLQTTTKGFTSRQWMDGASRAIAFSIAKRRLNVDWCREFTIENGQRVVLA